MAFELSRRRFLSAIGASAIPMKPKPFTSIQASPGATAQPHPILRFIPPIVAESRHVLLHEDKIREVAGWMAFEELAWPDFRFPLIPDGNDRDTMDFFFLASSINFAFTDFSSHTVFTTEYGGKEWSDAEAMMASLKRAYDEGRPVLEGDYLSRITVREADKIFRGNITIPMLPERVAIFQELGNALKDGHQGRFHRFIAAGPNRLYAEENGLLERLVRTFPSFNDVSTYRGKPVIFHKRAQLLLWMLHSRFRSNGFFRLEDAGSLTAFADYILPAALELHGILSYRKGLAATIERREIIAKDSEQEVELRAHTLWACHLLTRSINQLRAPGRQIIEPVLDGRLWTHYHALIQPHHLTRTSNY